MKRVLLGACVCFFAVSFLSAQTGFRATGANAEVDDEEPPPEITLTISWSPNPEPDIAGYRLYAGQYSGEYLVEMDLGNVTSISYEVLATKPYVFALTAYNTSGVESFVSEEISWPPELPEAQ